MSLNSNTIPAPAVAPHESVKPLLPWLVAVAFFMESLDTTILNTAVPAIAKALGVAPLTRKRWNRLLTAMKRTWPELQGIRVFEMHKRHGLHVHMVTNERIDVVQARALAEKAGWGRIHVGVCRGA